MNPTEWPDEIKKLIIEAAQLKQLQKISLAAVRVEESISGAKGHEEAVDNLRLNAFTSSQGLDTVSERIEATCLKHGINQDEVYAVINQVLKRLPVVQSPAAPDAPSP